MFSMREKANVLPKKRSLGAEIVQFFIAVSLLVIATQVKIALPFTPVPVTFQSITALVIGVAFGAKRGFFYTASYVVLTTFMVPALGTTSVYGCMFPSFGYLAAMPLASALTGYLYSKVKSKSMFIRSLPLLAGSLSIYMIGLPWLAMFAGWSNVLELGFYPFVALDLARAAIAGSALTIVANRR